MMLMFALLAWVVQPAQALATIQFRSSLTGSDEVPPNSDPTIGRGTFTRGSNVLSFRLFIPAESFIAQNAYIRGPALPGSNGPVIFELGGPTFVGGDSWGINPPGYRFFSPATPPFGAGPFPLTDAQINELESGLWYVNITSAKQPTSQLRGQILLMTTLTSFAYTNNQFQFSVRRAPTYSYIIQASTNLTSWTSLQTNDSPFTFTDALATNYPYRFYRVIR